MSGGLPMQQGSTTLKSGVADVGAGTGGAATYGAGTPYQYNPSAGGSPMDQLGAYRGNLTNALQSGGYDAYFAGAPKTPANLDDLLASGNSFYGPQGTATQYTPDQVRTMQQGMPMQLGETGRFLYKGSLYDNPAGSSTSNLWDVMPQSMRSGALSGLGAGTTDRDRALFSEMQANPQAGIGGLTNLGQGFGGSMPAGGTGGGGGSGFPGFGGGGGGATSAGPAQKSAALNNVAGLAGDQGGASATGMPQMDMLLRTIGQFVSNGMGAGGGSGSNPMNYLGSLLTGNGGGGFPGFGGGPYTPTPGPQFGNTRGMGQYPYQPQPLAPPRTDQEPGGVSPQPGPGGGEGATGGGGLTANDPGYGYGYFNGYNQSRSPLWNPWNYNQQAGLFDFGQNPGNFGGYGSTVRRYW